MLKILTLGAIGYVAYRYFERQKADAGAVRLAGGPLSKQATVRPLPDLT